MAVSAPGHLSDSEEDSENLSIFDNECEWY